MLGFILLGLFGLAQARPASVEGIVLRAGTSQPVSKAVVELSGNNLSPARVMATGADGKFEFRGLAAGSYRLAVSREGFLNGSYGQRGPNGTGTPLVLDAGQARKDVRLTMVATGAISGRVYDNTGEPLANVPVRAFKYALLDGDRTLTQVKADVTDDRGEYRLFWLPPGLYYIGAEPQGGRIGPAMIVMAEGAGGRMIRADSENPRSTADKLGEADVPVYYPGTTDAAAAQPVEVRTGSDVGGVDFSLVRVKTHKVSGTLIDGTTGQQIVSASVLVFPRNVSAISARRMGLTSSRGFEIQGVPPGSYYIVSTYRANAGGGSFRIIGGRTALDVNNADVDRVTVVLSQATDIRGIVQFEGGRDAAANNTHPIVSLKNQFAGAPGLTQHWAQFSDNQQFVINDVVEGDYDVQVLDLPKGAYVKSIRFGSADALNASLTTDRRSNERLEITLSMNSGTLDGTVVGRNREAIGSAQVALIPDSAHRQRSDLYFGARTDESGKFHLEGVAPGDYSLVAWEDIEEGLWRDPEFARRNESTAQRISIREGSRESVELAAIPYPF
jgi:hypothetical protein